MNFSASIVTVQSLNQEQNAGVLPLARIPSAISHFYRNTVLFQNNVHL